MDIRIKFIEENIRTNDLKKKNYIGIYLFGIRIKRIYLDRRKKKREKKIKNNILFNIIKPLIRNIGILKKLLCGIKVKKLDLKLGINLSDPLINAYSIAIINSILPFFLINSSREIQKGKIYYKTFISKKLVEIDIDCIISISIAKNIFSIIRVLYIILKGGILNGNKTSNRISHDNINDLNREYGRC